MTEDKRENIVNGSEPVDELISTYPQLAAWLRDRGLGCYQCGEVFWGPLVDLYKTKKRTVEGFDNLIAELNAFLQSNV